MGRITKPRIITADMDVSEFCCGEPSLDDWLKKRAFPNLGLITTTYVICDDNKVIGYYGSCAGAISTKEIPAGIRHGWPTTIPAYILARLAVDKKYQNKKIGRALLKHAIKRALTLKNRIAMGFIVVHALHENAAEFYLKYGFVRSPLNPHTLIYPLKGKKFN